MPGYGNQIPYGNVTMQNWWVFQSDWDGAILQGKATSMTYIK
ncbi:MAG: hypothetical protein R3F24_07975 [Gammaproteobacteria bacterium]